MKYKMGIKQETTKGVVIMKYKMDIKQEEEIEDLYTSDPGTIKQILTEVFEEWQGWNWIESFKFHSVGKFSPLIVCFTLVMYDEWSRDEICCTEELTETINRIFNSFKSGYQKKYFIYENKEAV
jgi:hypothetical protein